MSSEVLAQEEYTGKVSFKVDVKLPSKNIDSIVNDIFAECVDNYQNNLDHNDERRIKNSREDLDEFKKKIEKFIKEINEKVSSYTLTINEGGRIKQNYIFHPEYAKHFVSALEDKTIDSVNKYGKDEDGNPVNPPEIDKLQKERIRLAKKAIDELVKVLKDSLKRNNSEEVVKDILKSRSWVNGDWKEETASQEEQTISMEASPKRKKVEKFILDYIGKIVSGDDNVNLYKSLFKSMSDKEFHQFMLDLRDKKKTLSIIVPNGDKKNTVSLEKNLKIAKELGLELFQQLKVTNQKDAPDYITPHKYLILKLPLRRAAQLLSKGISVPDNSKITDRLTGQVTAGSRSGKITYPEIQVLLGLGMKATLRELLKLRGGDLGSANAMNQSLTKIGKVNQGEIDRYSTGVVSTKTLKAYFNAIHVKSTL